jgi:hypothetical protein
MAVKKLMKRAAQTAVALLVVVGGVPAAIGQSGVLPPENTRELFNGVWDYHPEQSVDAATGRPEQGPTGPAAARDRARPEPGDGRQRPPSGRDRGGGGFGGDGFGGGGFGGGGFGNSGYQPPSRREVLANLNRSLHRDLLEVPETLAITVEPEAVTFVDDLERTYTFPTDRQQHRYIVSAARFDARTYWDGARLHKQIQGPRGFRLSETYFLSSDGQRMFVVIRLGEQPQAEGEPIDGVNRVYDRIDGQTASHTPGSSSVRNGGGQP